MQCCPLACGARGIEIPDSQSGFAPELPIEDVVIVASMGCQFAARESAGEVSSLQHSFHIFWNLVALSPHREDGARFGMLGFKR
jgi:hypothetical protein